MKDKQDIRKAFISEQIGTDLKAYFFNSFLVPFVKKTLLDVIGNVTGSLTTSVENMFGIVKNKSNAEKIGYSSIYNGTVQQASVVNSSIFNPRTVPSMQTTDYDTIIYPSYNQAADIISKIRTLISVKGYASIQDLYQLCKIQGSHTDVKWGWKQLPNDIPIIVSHEIGKPDGFKISWPVITPIA